MTAPQQMTELDRESRMGDLGTERDRAIPQIDLSDFEARRGEITEQLWSAATEVGFFQIVNHGIEATAVDRAFAMAEAFFDLPVEVKQQYPLDRPKNSGWESGTQVRPSVGTPDRKESYQITRPHMGPLFPSDAQLPEFREFMLGFETRCWELAMRVLSCFAEKLGFEREFFTGAHDPSADTYQSTLRILHYPELPGDVAVEPGVWRAGAHTDFDCLTLLFQRTGQGGLQVCPGRDLDAPEWTSVVPSDEAITCNIGDMLMRWSDDQLRSTFHRVRMPGAGEYTGARYSMPFFAQANREVLIETPGGTYPPITAADYIAERIRANYGTPAA